MEVPTCVSVACLPSPPVRAAVLDYGREGAGFVRLNFGTSPEHVTDAVQRMVCAMS